MNKFQLWFSELLFLLLVFYGVAVNSREFIRFESATYTVQEIVTKANSIAFCKVYCPWQSPLDFEVFLQKGDYHFADVFNIVMDSTSIAWRYHGDGNIELYEFQESSMVRFKGKIVDSKTGSPIPYAEIVTEDYWRTISDSQGNFLLDLYEFRTTVWVVADDRRQMLQVMAEEGSYGETIEMNISIESGAEFSGVLDDNFLERRKGDVDQN